VGVAPAGPEYASRLAARLEVAQQRKIEERRIGTARMVVFLTILVVLWLAIDVELFSPVWALVPVLAFVRLVVVHDRVIRQRRTAERAAAFYGEGVARIEDRWAGAGNGGDRFLDAKHPYAVDLDIFGRGSLFERLCTARTRSGEETLARWLLSPASAGEIAARQEAVAELAPRLDLREAIALAGEDVRISLDVEILSRWSAAAALPALARYRVAAAVTVIVLVATAGAWAIGVGPIPFLIAFLAAGLLTRHLRPHVHRITNAVQHPARDLGVFAELLALLEGQRFTAPRLLELAVHLQTDAEPASQRIARLRRLVHLLDAMKNQLFAPLGLLLMWETHVALAIEAWRVRHGAAIAAWLDAVSEIEALSAFAAMAYENPDATYPRIVDGPPRFEAEGLGHPLLPAASCVRNTLQLHEQPRVWIVSGSNMSGKSTLLRAVGINAVLALAGAPVRARAMRLTILNVGASIRTLDSLQEGTSRFYAEIKRLRQIMDLAAGATPLLFLLDEVLHGTNSHDRGIGSEALVRGFLARNAIGLVTTHDLALARVADVLAPVAGNVHFEDHLENGEMRFDYTMHPGVVTHSNALALMRAVGLDV